MKKLVVSEFGDPILRRQSATIKIKDINGSETQNLIESMKELLLTKKLGIGLAAPQIGISLRLAVITIRASKHRPDAKPFDLVIINPEIIETAGRRKQMYEGCISGGPNRSGLFARVPRYKKIKLKYYNQNGNLQKKYFEGLTAHVLQHEVDHLNGVLFVDRVKDSKSYVTYKEYLKLAKAKADAKIL